MFFLRGGGEETPAGGVPIRIAEGTQSLVLVAAVRGAPETPFVELEPATRVLRLEVDLEASSVQRGDRVTVRLEVPEDTARIALDAQSVAEIAGIPALIVEIPSSQLGHGRHALELTAAGRDIGNYPFDVRAPVP